jgi:multimeric flavodoxin WrbA
MKLKFENFDFLRGCHISPFAKKPQIEKLQMKIIALSFSHRKGGNIDILTKRLIDGCREYEKDSKAIFIREKTILPCTGCMKCQKEGVCKINDEMESVSEEMLISDAIVFGSPVYFWNVNSLAKIFLDRTYALRFPNLKLMNKAAAIICVASSRGNMKAISFLQNYITSNHMFVVDYASGLAMKKGSIKNDLHAMYSAYELGRLLTLFIKNGNRYPDEFNKPIYAYVKDKYQVHMSPFENI